MAPVNLKNVTVSTIKPFAKTEHPTILKPSVYDLPPMDVYTPIVFFYKTVKGLSADPFNFVEHLKESLSKVLVPYYQIAGRWIRTYDHRMRELECNDEGVPFIEASIDEELESVVNLKDFETVELLGGYEIMGLDVKRFNQDVDIPLPPLFVQVTHFKDGAVALHVTFSHQVADGEGMLTFMNAWSQIALCGQTSIVPNHDRSLVMSFGEFMKSAGNAREKTGDEDAHAKESTSDKDAENREDDKDVRIDPGAAFKTQRDPTRNKTLHVRRRVIEDLKREAAEKNMEVTTVDLISAHIWRSLNNLPVSIDGKTSSIVGTWIDGRKRFHNPPLPEHYSGNAIVVSYTPRIPAAELENNSPLFAANIVHNVVKAVNASNWQRSVLGFMQILNDIHHSEYRQLMISSWFRFPMYEINFDHRYGKPVFASSDLSCGLLPLGMVTIHPPPPMLSEDAIASLQVVVQETNGAAQALFSDEKFLSFFL